MENKKSLVPQEAIEKRIFVLRGEKVILSIHLAELYNVRGIALNQAVKRNIKRFPDDFMFQLNNKEVNWLVSQNVIPHIKLLGGYLPYAFTEQGVAMLSSVLRSQRAIEVNIAIVRAFVNLRKFISSHKKLALKLKELEDRVNVHDDKISTIFEAIRQLMKTEEKPKRKIGFLS